MPHVVPRLFKYVDLADAHFIEAGSVRIGTLVGYADLEGAKQDAMEGRVERHMDNFVLNDQTPNAIQLRKLFGMPAGQLEMINSKFVHSVPNVFTFCLSVDPNAEALQEKPQAIFELLDYERFFQLVTLQNPCLGEKAVPGRIIYQPRSVDVRVDATSQPNIFIKDPIFQGEAEFRIAWTESKQNAELVKGWEKGWEKRHLADGKLPFNTEPSAEIAKLFQRLNPHQS